MYQRATFPRKEDPLIRPVFAVHDHAAEAYLDPFTAQSRGAAIRSFSDAVNDASHPFAKHPEHYTLYMIGVFNMETGEVVGSKHESCGNAVEYVLGNQLNLLPGGEASA